MKGLRVSMMKNKDMISDCNLDFFQKCLKYPCGVGFRNLGSNSVFSIVVNFGFIKNVG